MPVTVIAGILGLYLSRTKLKPNVADAPTPHIVPTKTLPWGAFKTSSPLATEIPTPIRAKKAVIHVELVVFSPRINIEKIVKEHSNFRALISKHPMVSKTRQTGTIIAIEIKIEQQTGYFVGIRDLAYDFFIENGILLRPLGNIIFINPPYCISSDQLQFIYSKIELFLNKISNDAWNQIKSKP